VYLVRIKGEKIWIRFL